MATPRAALEAAYADHRRGNTGRAEKQYRSLLRHEPDNPDALYLLGMLYLEQDKAGEAAPRLERAAAAARKASRRVDPGWRLALGTARQRLGDHVGALDAFEAALRDDPQSVDALFCKATALQELERLEDAARAYEVVLKRVPRHAEAANNLGAVHRDLGNHAASVRAFRAALSFKPDYVEANRNLGVALADGGRAADAVPLLRRAIESERGDAGLREALFQSLVQVGMIDEYENRIRTLLEKEPENAVLIAHLGLALQFQGNGEGAADLFRKALMLDPDTSGAHAGLADIKGESGITQRIEEVERLLERENLVRNERIMLHFALGRHYEAADRRPDALEQYIEGNAVRRMVLAENGREYDRAGFESKIEALIAAYDPGRITGAAGSRSGMPVFIVGMPRSGTTLTEQILANHRSVFGAGELQFMHRAARELERRAGYPAAPTPDEALARIAEAYLGPLAELGNGALRVTDKMPGNFMLLGLITQLFPKARIIHCRRDPMDTCLSCFTQNFHADGLAWSCDLEDLGHQYGQYRRIMKHWRDVLPSGRMLEIDYEDTVADLEGQARRIIDFTGLEWDDACLRFHETERAVITASVSQVRRKVYSTSVGRWKRYGDGVLPLARALDACGCGPGVMGEGSHE